LYVYFINKGNKLKFLKIKEEVIGKSNPISYKVLNNKNPLSIKEIIELKVKDELENRNIAYSENLRNSNVGRMILIQKGKN
jgi:hypothetical protein